MNGDAAAAGEASRPCATEASGARTAPAIAMLAPFRKSRRLISGFMPSSRSLFFISCILEAQGVAPEIQPPQLRPPPGVYGGDGTGRPHRFEL